MTIAIGAGPLPVAAFHIGGSGLSPPAPTPIFTNIVIEGDSVTSNDPQTNTEVGFYSYAWRAANPGKTVTVTADGSRTVGGAAYNGNAENLPGTNNTLFQQVANDLAFGPQLLTAKIGVNDISSTGVLIATYIQRLKDWAALIRAGGAKIAYGVPTPVALGTEIIQAEYDFYMGKWETLFTTQDIRNPANWSQWADYYIPLGEHPDFRDGTPWTLDGVHPTGPSSTPSTGQAKLLAVYSAAMDTLMDTARVTAAGPYQSVWDAFGPFTDLEVGTPLTRRVVVSGLAWAGSATGISVTGGDATVKTNGKVAPGYSYNGDVIDFTLTPSATHETDTAVQLTIGGETRTLTFRTGVQAVAVAYTHGGVNSGSAPVASTSFSGVFAAGKPIITVYRNSVATGVTVGGVAAVRRLNQTHYSNNGLEVWEAPEQAGGNLAVVITYTANSSRTAVMYGAIVGGTFVSAAGVVTGNSDPRLAPTATVPGNGLLLGFLGMEGADPLQAVGVNSGTTFVAQAEGLYQGSRYAATLGTRTASGQASFNFARFTSTVTAALVYGAS